MKRLSPLLFIVMLAAACLVPGQALAHTSGHIEINSTNMYRGLDLSQGVGVHGGIDYEHISGFHLGLSALNMQQGNRAALQAGYGTRALNWGYDIGAVYYTFSEHGEFSDERHIDYTELYGVLSLGPINLSAWFTPDMLNTDESAWYLEADYTWRGRTGIGFELNLGVAAGDYYDLAKDERPDGLFYAGQEGARVTSSYFTWGAALTRTTREFTWSMGVEGTDRGSVGDLDGENASDRVKWVLGLERRFDF